MAVREAMFNVTCTSNIELEFLTLYIHNDGIPLIEGKCISRISCILYSIVSLTDCHVSIHAG